MARSSLVFAGAALLTACASSTSDGFGDSGLDSGRIIVRNGPDATTDARGDVTEGRDAPTIVIDGRVISVLGDAASDSTARDARSSDGGIADGHGGASDAAEDRAQPSDALHDVARDASKEEDAAKDASHAKDSGVDAGPEGTLLFLGTATAGTLAGQRHPGAAWTSTTLAASGSSFAPALTTLSDGTAVGAFTVGSATSGAVTATTWTAGGGWQAPASLGAMVLSQAQPYIDGTGGTTAHLVYEDTSYHFQYLAYTGATWATAPLAVQGNYGPVPAAVAALGSNATVGFVDGADVNSLASCDLVGGTFQAHVDLGDTASFTVPPAIVALSSGPQLLMVYVDQNASILYVTRTTGTWSGGKAIATAFTGNPVALAALPGGDAILAFRGQDSNLYWSLYSGGAWSTVAAFATPTVAVTGAPAVAHGVGGDVAEIAYVASSGEAYSSSLDGTSWTTPTLIGGTSLVGVAIAATP